MKIELHNGYGKIRERAIVDSQEKWKQDVYWMQDDETSAFGKLGYFLSYLDDRWAGLFGEIQAESLKLREFSDEMAKLGGAMSEIMLGEVLFTEGLSVLSKFRENRNKIRRNYDKKQIRRNFEYIN